MGTIQHDPTFFPRLRYKILSGEITQLTKIEYGNFCLNVDNLKNDKLTAFGEALTNEINTGISPANLVTWLNDHDVNYHIQYRFAKEIPLYHNLHNWVIIQIIHHMERKYMYFGLSNCKFMFQRNLSESELKEFREFLKQVEDEDGISPIDIVPWLMNHHIPFKLKHQFTFSEKPTFLENMRFNLISFYGIEKIKHIIRKIKKEYHLDDNFNSQRTETESETDA